ncbi:MAG TPA: hypothetical protein VFT50_03450 [Baekduia sp.]|nr:hypothetical protein [Baekduia sp.]
MAGWSWGFESLHPHESIRGVRLRPAHLLLIGLALVMLVLGATIVAGVLRSGDNSVWNAVVLGAVVVVLAGALAGFALFDARRGRR